MATFTSLCKTFSAGSGLVASTKHGMNSFDVEIDFSDLRNEADPPDTGDIINICEVPIGCEIVSVAANVAVACTDPLAVTANVGITGGVTNCFFVNLDLKTAGKNYPLCTTEAQKFITVLAGAPTSAARTIAMILTCATGANTNLLYGKVVFRITLRDFFA